MIAAHPLFLDLIEDVVGGGDEYTNRIKVATMRRSFNHLAALSSGWIGRRHGTMDLLSALVWRFRDNGATDIFAFGAHL